MGRVGESGVNLPLTDYGLFDEQSDIRVHVGVASRSLYVFKTQAARTFLSVWGHRYEQRPAYQPGVQGMTALGWKVPWKDIPSIRKVYCPSYPLWSDFRRTESTSDKGKKAVAVVQAMLTEGHFPLWVSANETIDTKMQINGTDLIVWHKTRIQVKCDWNAGDGGEGCTGNLYIQTAERNPLRKL